MKSDEKTRTNKSSRASMFQDLKSNDPKLKINDEDIILSPFYWNYSFITNLLPIAGASYIIAEQDDQQINVLCFLIIGGSIFLLIRELSYYNALTINTNSRTIRIRPSPLFRLIRKERIIELKGVRVIDFKSTSFLACLQALLDNTYFEGLRSSQPYKH